MRFNFKFLSLNKIRNISICLLVLLAIYQTGQLWFENLSNRNFFYTFLNSSADTSSSRQQSEGIPPYRIITGFGNKNLYHIAYGGMTSGFRKTDCDNAIVTLLRDGEYIGKNSSDIDELMQNRLYIYCYSFPMPADVFAKSYGQKSNLLTSRLKTFDSLVILPSRSSDERIRFLFIDKVNGQSYEYACPIKPSTESMSRNIQSIQPETAELFYVSSEQSGFRMFERNTYIPQWPGNSLVYYPANITNPYVDGEKLIANIGRKVDAFFDNPATRLPGVSNDGVFTYWDENTVVKYHAANDVLEYVSYKTTEKRTGQDFLSAYYSAVDFIEADSNVTNYYYLADYTQSDTRITFYFDYIMDNFPIVIPDSLKNDSGMDHHLEVSVENQRVSRYKKLVYNYHLDESSPETARLDFYGSLNSLFASDIAWSTETSLTDDQQQEGTGLGDAVLGYKVDRNNRLLLYWFLEIEGVSYIKSAY